ncbi:MAG: OsmC family protein [Thermoleophilia bacterium]|nr:OsmC family protein [Thermoleophilia bacterium]
MSSDEFASIGGTDTAPSPAEQLLAALGNCLVVGYVAYASIAGITIEELRITVEGDIDLHSFLGVRDGHAGYRAIRATVHLRCDADGERLADLHRRVSATSPVGDTLSTGVTLTVTPAAAS